MQKGQQLRVRRDIPAAKVPLRREGSQPKLGSPAQCTRARKRSPHKVKAHLGIPDLNGRMLCWRRALPAHSQRAGVLDKPRELGILLAACGSGLMDSQTVEKADTLGPQE